MEARDFYEITCENDSGFRKNDNSSKSLIYFKWVDQL
jgi:hypothetical protein